ncbi:hypothetical protein [Clostridium butyricum]|uniref:Uncharacterized protein n=1 Tax=Clostridium butyricum TaxID=1492 RepID=A0AAP9RFN7_CLOBU|nr:hypothetical protein [Clostridium butyricum]MBZ5746936.1 hypothetical protein [Clostridium butyricum]MDI9208035.1 hypothetical protein [Clostridium butyricum]QMW91803.1 hypothetical protein FF104_12730 [Clostridium butyricum]BBK75978.1 hypothetical protein Cbu04g_09860 [Clostridium butyricum]GEQ25859.1 hypothetical protein CBU03nite_22820 [Clostridium butyricum]
MSKSLRFCFKVSEKLGLAFDENGNNCEAYICVKANDVKSYKVPGADYKDMHDGFRKITAYQMQCDPEMLTPITLNEYLDNTEEDE